MLSSRSTTAAEGETLDSPSSRQPTSSSQIVFFLAAVFAALLISPGTASALPCNPETRIGGSSEISASQTAQRGASTPRHIRQLGRSVRQLAHGLGVFINQDPIGFAGGLNLYQYVGNNPLRYTDPLGLAGGSILVPLAIALLATMNRSNPEAPSAFDLPDETLIKLLELLGASEGQAEYGAAGCMLAAGGVGLVKGTLRSGRRKLISLLKALLARKAGFSGRGVPLILDNSLGVSIKQLAKLLRDKGFDARTVGEIFDGVDPKDPNIRRLAQQLGGRVVASDRGRQLGQGFGELGIHIPGAVRLPETALRLIEEALKK